jgi:hypothetical protein
MMLIPFRYLRIRGSADAMERSIGAGKVTKKKNK